MAAATNYSIHGNAIQKTYHLKRTWKVVALIGILDVVTLTSSRVLHACCCHLGPFRIRQADENRTTVLVIEEPDIISRLLMGSDYSS